MEDWPETKSVKRCWHDEAITDVCAKKIGIKETVWQYNIPPTTLKRYGQEDTPVSWGGNSDWNRMKDNFSSSVGKGAYQIFIENGENLFWYDKVMFVASPLTWH